MKINQSEVSFFDPIAYLADPFKNYSPPSPPTTNPFDLLKFYGLKAKRLASEEPKVQSFNISRNDSCPSSVMILESAKTHVQEMISKNADALSILSNSLRYSPGLPSFVFKETEITILLHAAAENVAAQKFTCARKLLRVCKNSSSKNGTPMQRIVYYFSESLEVRIDNEIGLNHERHVKTHIKPQDEIQTRYSLQPAVMARPQEFKNIQEISQFAGIQSILDNIGSAIRLHIIDLGIRNGSQWTILMQALSERKIRPIKHLKITAIGTSQETLINTGKRLWSFADTLKLSFSFGIVISDLKDIKKESLEIDLNETIAIYSSMSLFSLVAWPIYLGSLMEVIRSLKPRVIVVHELHASIDSPVFLERFNGAFSYYTTLFDFLSILGNDHSYRNLMEGTYYRLMMRNILTAEGTKRIQRHGKIDFWRALLIRYGFVETPVSSSVLSQVKMLQNTSNLSYNSCTMDLDEKSLVLGWKGNPMEFVSTWKLHRL